MSSDAEAFQLPPDAWTAIAVRPLKVAGESLPLWTPLPGAAITLEQATRLRLSGDIIMASRHDRERIELVVRLVAWP